MARKAAKRPQDKAADLASFEALRRDVREWYRAEAERLAEAHARAGDVEALDFAELVRRSQALFACEMMALLEGEAGPAAQASPRRAEPELDPADLAQLERVAKAMEAQGKAVPEAIAAALRAQGHS